MGAGADAYTSDDGSTALMVAAKQGHGELVQALLQAGAKAALKNAAGDTAATLAKRGTPISTALAKAASDGRTEVPLHSPSRLPLLLFEEGVTNTTW